MNATPPDSPPSSQSRVASPGGTPPPRDGRAVDANRGVAWWSEGWRLFTASPVIWIVIALLYVALVFGLHLIPLIGQVAATILTPVIAAGVIVGCRRLDGGGELAVADLFAGFGANVGPLVLLGVLYFACWLIALVIAVAVFGIAFGFGALSSIWSGEPMRMLAALGLGAVIVLLVLLLFSVPLVMAFWFAPALVALRNDEPFASLKSSFVASLRNVVPFLVYGLLGVVFGIAATIPLGLGWFVLGPVFAASVYASYKDIFGV